MKERKCDLYKADRAKGMTYKEIAEKYGVSTQAVGIACSKSDPSYFRYITKKQCIYVGLREWMNDNKVSGMALVRMLGYNAEPQTYSRIFTYLRGKNSPRKCIIDKLLEITGLPYEELFMED